MFYLVIACISTFEVFQVVLCKCLDNVSAYFGIIQVSSRVFLNQFLSNTPDEETLDNLDISFYCHITNIFLLSWLMRVILACFSHLHMLYKQAQMSNCDLV